MLNPPFYAWYYFHPIAIYIRKLWLLCWIGPPILLLSFMSLLSITIESLLSLVQHTSISHTLGRTTLVIIRLHFILFSILVISSLTNPGSRDQYPIVLMFYIHDFRECVTKIFSLVTSDDIISDSGIIDRYICWII